MNGHRVSVAIGVLMLLAGLVLYFGFHDVQTPVVGLRQLGLVLAALGLIETVVSGYAVLRPPAKER